ncbi:MAG: esterase, partial [Lachnospiraceae bacterium]|nr:esterase [Lachnospiraceae bacterium]
MERWGFYVSGIRYGICEKEEGRIFHEPLQVEKGTFAKRRELTKEEKWYWNLGRMDVLEALCNVEEYEATLAAGKESFTTPSGTRYERKSEKEYAERGKKYPRDLLTADGKIIAFVTPGRDFCAILVREGFEEQTILSKWNSMYPDAPYRVSAPKTYMVAMQD